MRESRRASQPMVVAKVANPTTVFCVRVCAFLQHCQDGTRKLEEERRGLPEGNNELTQRCPHYYHYNLHMSNLKQRLWFQDRTLSENTPLKTKVDVIIGFHGQP